MGCANLSGGYSIAAAWGTETLSVASLGDAVVRGLCSRHVVTDPALRQGSESLACETGSRHTRAIVLSRAYAVLPHAIFMVGIRLMTDQAAAGLCGTFLRVSISASLGSQGSTATENLMAPMFPRQSCMPLALLHVLFLYLPFQAKCGNVWRAAGVHTSS